MDIYSFKYMNKYNHLGVKEEKYNFRDQWLSSRHRLFGIDCPLTDIDCIITREGEVSMDNFKGLEYDNGIPVGLIEYKHWNWNGDPSSKEFKAMTWMADKCEIPFFIVRYHPEEYKYFVIPMNTFAKKVPLLNKSKLLSEDNFVKMLYWIRKRKCPPEVLENLQKERK